jgi:hypothetical protein
MLSFVPTSWLSIAVNFILIAGALGLVVGTIFKSIPFVKNYSAIIRGISLIFLVSGTYFTGGLAVEKEWRAKVEEMKQKVAEAEAKSGEVNTIIKNRVVEKIKVVKETRDANIQIVEKVVTKYDSMCTLSNAAIVLHNSASRNEVSPSAGASLEGASNVKASDLIRTVTDNYSTYYQVREQLIGWQDWYKEQKKIYESVK